MGSPQQTDLVLAAFNARYAHCAFGARCLMANLGDLQERALMMEFDLSEPPRAIVEKILATNPRILSIGCYIWNIDLVTRIAALVKAIRPDIHLVLGGPEISYETEQQAVFRYADHIICGEGEDELPKLCRRLLNQPDADRPRIIRAEPVDVSRMTLPYAFYTDEDLAHRAVYVEASRGCPFRCEYCMSSLDPCVRHVPEDTLLPALENLLERGARTFRFVDRTFNLDIDRALRLLDFFCKRHVPGMLLHFEVIPERLPDALLEAVQACPHGLLQFEVGIQTLNEEVADRISRPLNMAAIETNLRRLREDTGVHIHADLIAGLPGEDLKSFAAGFDRLLVLQPHEIQVGILKRLRGAPIDRHTTEWDMIYSPHAPYEVLQTASISFQDMQRIQRFARYWNLIVNNGRFPNTAPLIRQDIPSAFEAFMQFSDWLYAETGTTGNLHVMRLARLLFDYLVRVRQKEERTIAEAVWKDHCRSNRPDVPGFLKQFGFEKPTRLADKSPGLLPRQQRHQKDHS